MSGYGAEKADILLSRPKEVNYVVSVKHVLSKSMLKLNSVLEVEEG